MACQLLIGESAVVTQVPERAHLYVEAGTPDRQDHASEGLSGGMIHSDNRGAFFPGL